MDKREKKVKEFQAVILAGGSGSGLYPFTLETPKSLLPMGNATLLSYQLWALEASGFTHVIVVCPQKSLDEFDRVVSEVYSGDIQVDFHGVRDEEGDEDSAFVGGFGSGSTNGLRALKGKIHSDVIVFAGDTVTNASLHELADVHRVNDAAVTMLLKQHENAKDKDSRKVLQKLNKSLANFYGLVRESGSNTGRVVMMKSAPADDPVHVPKTLMVRYPRMDLHADMVDGHVYILKKWVFDLLCAEDASSPLCDEIKLMQSLRAEFIPFVVNKLQLFLAEKGALGDAESETSPTVPLPHVEKAGSSLRSALAMSAIPSQGDSIGCYAYVAPEKTIVYRANTLFGYNMINQGLVKLPTDVKTPFPRPSRHPKFKTAAVGAESEIGANVILKNCVIGAHCKIGDGVTVANSVVMDHCSIEEKVILQGSVVGSNVKIKDSCDLQDVQLQSGSSVAAKTRLKGQAYLRSDLG